MTTVHLLHGIHSAGEVTVDKLMPYLKDAGLTAVYPDYGWIGALETRIVNPAVVGALLPYIKPGDVLLGHSNGCAIAQELMRQGAPAVGAVYINAALDDKIARPNDIVKWIRVYWNPGDEITIAAKLGAESGIVDPFWGEMGHAGYTGTDPVFTSIGCHQQPTMPVVSGHGEIFLPPALTSWGPYIARDIVQMLAR